MLPQAGYYVQKVMSAVHKMSNGIARGVRRDVTYHDITMRTDVAMILFYYVSQ